MTFVSYARADSEFALRPARDLKSAGAPVWLDQLDIKPGQRWDKAVEEALTRCNQMLVILAPAAVDSHNVTDEYSYALDERKTVIPVLHQQCSVPFRLRRLHYADCRQEYKAGLTSLLGTLDPVSRDDPTAPPAASKLEPATPRAGEVRTNPADGALYVWIPPGNFQMGCSPGSECYEEEKPAHAVRITRGFWMGRTPVTQAAYKKLMGAKPSNFEGPASG